MQSLTVPRTYKVKIPLVYTDDHGRSHAPLDGAYVEVSNPEIADARIDDSCLVIEAKETGQAQVLIHAPMGGEDEEEIKTQIMLTVTAQRQEDERPQEGPSRIELAMAQAEFEGNAKPADPDRRRERQRRREMRHRALREADETNRDAERQDRERAERQPGRTAEQLALEARGPATPQHPSGAEMANRLAAQQAGAHGVDRAGMARVDFPNTGRQDNPDDPDRPHNPGNQGGGDTTGYQAAGQRTQTPEMRGAAQAGEPRDADKAEDARPGARSHGQASEESREDDKAKSGQQRGGAAQAGTPTSAPGSRRG